jgi:hypothetical protein
MGGQKCARLPERGRFPREDPELLVHSELKTFGPPVEAGLLGDPRNGEEMLRASA